MMQRRNTIAAGCTVLLLACLAKASDHADPIDPLYLQRQEGAITDLFVFPVLANGQPAYPFEYDSNLPLHDTLADVVREPLSKQQQGKIDSLVFILCLRRELTDAGALKLEPYRYRIHIDIDSEVVFPSDDVPKTDSLDANASSHADSHGGISAVEAFARYGGKISHPDRIREDITIEFQLSNDALLVGAPKFSGSATSGWDADEVTAVAGVFDDPFIFPTFFGTNIVGIACQIPIGLFPEDRPNLLVWATSHRGSLQIDHVGRSLRTQNPRFELLNQLHPSQHVERLVNEHEYPSLMRDIKLRLNLGSLFAFRRWDFVPDVMCYSPKYPVGFPNGRLLTDDVAAILARHGDTLLYELSFQDNKSVWPRRSTNDTNNGQFQPTFPYLNPPFADREQPPLRRLSARSIAKLIGIGLILIMLLVIENFLVARLYHYLRSRKERYL